MASVGHFFVATRLPHPGFRNARFTHVAAPWAGMPNGVKSITLLTRISSVRIQSDIVWPIPSVRSAVTNVTVTIHSVNDAPLARDDTAKTLKDTPVTVEVLQNDDDKDGELAVDSLTITDPPAHGRLYTMPTP